MFGKKEKPKRQRPAGSLAQYGIFEVPDNLDDIGADYGADDADLEAELAALTGGDDAGSKSRRNAGQKPISDANLDAMIAESMKDINLNEDMSDEEDDPELLNELQMITGDGSHGRTSPEEEHFEHFEEAETTEDGTSMDSVIKMLHERLALYESAEKKAKRENEAGRARRYNRGVRTIRELLSHANAGKTVNEADIPPPLPASATAETVEKTPEESTPPATVETDASVVNEDVIEPATADTVDQESLHLLQSRQQEYKVAAVAWKRSGNMQEALQHIQIVKQFDRAIAAVNAGERIDVSEIPPSPHTPPTVASATPTPPEKQESETQQSSANTAPAESVSAPPSGPENLEMALKERLEVYRRSKTTAETEGNSSKARRYGRICKQFEDALKLYVRGKPIVLEDLPVPPGFPPLSDTPQASKPTPEDKPANSTAQPSAGSAMEPVASGNDTVPARPKPPIPPARTGKNQNQKITSRAEKQMIMLQQRQHELRQAALTAKKDGDLELARDYLRQAKGIQPLIEASIGGLPVDMNSIPLSPHAKLELDAHGITAQAGDSFTLVSREDCVEEVGGTDDQIYENLEAQLHKQIKWCLSTRDHSKALGDVPGYNKWERLALSYTRDLDMVRVRKRDALPPPQHHYETKTYAIVQSCTDLTDSDVELSIIRGVNYSKEADTYVMFEFPYPTDSPSADRTSIVKGSSNPEYQEVFPLSGIIDRSSRQCQRAFKRHALKCQVWSKGCSLNPILCCTHPRGFLRSDSLLGTVTVKLQPLETHCELHDSFPLMDGRKTAGGKLELKLRLRNPILTKQIEQITDKWLTIDH